MVAVEAGLFNYGTQYIYLLSMVVYMVEVKGGRGMYIEVFFMWRIHLFSCAWNVCWCDVVADTNT